MNRRGFLGGILSAAAAPAIVRADSLMRVVPMQAEVLLPATELYVTMGSSCILSPDAITRAALELIRQKYGPLRLVSEPRVQTANDIVTDRLLYRTSVIVEGSPTPIPRGDTIQIRLPNRYTLTRSVETAR